MKCCWIVSVVAASLCWTAFGNRPLYAVSSGGLDLVGASLHQQQGSALATTAIAHRGPLNFGDPKCPCIGFAGLAGEVSVKLDGKSVAYPADLASSCEAWDDGRHPSCLEGKEPGKGQGWCAEAWCYVDISECDLPVLPKISGYLPHATYVAKPLYFSYLTCGGTNTYSDKTPEVGVAGCRCVGFEHREGTIPVQIDSGKMDYPAELGGSCQAWDKDRHPSCKAKDGETPPSWCAMNWCFVNPCECQLEVPPKVSGYLPEVTFRGRPLYYSYAACGEKDEYTEANRKEACVNQKTESECAAIEKCGWTGDMCKGKELIDACSTPVGHESGSPSNAEAAPSTHTGGHSGAPAAGRLGTILVLALSAAVHWK